ncbi:MAG: hypothetical protein ACRD15_00630 [Vicinamibacterales bacterium]
MSHLRTPSSRTLTVVLSETEWRALREVEPDAVGWLQDRIRERLGTVGHAEAKANGTPVPTAATAASCWGDDEY